MGSTQFAVGTADQIFKGNATITKEMIAKARTEKNQKQAKAAVAQAPALPKAPAKPPPAVGAGAISPPIVKVVVVKAADIKFDDVFAMKKTLKADFLRADAKFTQWKPVP